MIDGHIDLPILVREFYGNDLSQFDLKKETVSFSVPIVPACNVNQTRCGTVFCMAG